MKLKMRTCGAGATDRWQPGDERDFPEEVGKALVESGQASLIEMVASAIVEFEPEDEAATAAGEVEPEDEAATAAGEVETAAAAKPQTPGRRNKKKR